MCIVVGSVQSVIHWEQLDATVCNFITMPPAVNLSYIVCDQINSWPMISPLILCIIYTRI